MDMEILRDMVFISLFLFFVLLGIIGALQIKIYKYKHKIYFIRRDRERCTEVLFAAKDGYFCFVYPDQKVKDPQKEIKEKCSRRLAVMLGIKSGTAASFTEILEVFYKEDAKILKKYVNLLQQEGKPFEDMLRLKGNDRDICVYGNRINGADNNLYCDIVWFRDVSRETAKIRDLAQEKKSVQDNLDKLEQMIDGVDYPIWLRNENLQLLAINKKYMDFVPIKNKSEIISGHVEISNNKGEKIAEEVAESAQKSKKCKRKS